MRELRVILQVCLVVSLLVLGACTHDDDTNADEAMDESTTEMAAEEEMSDDGMMDDDTMDDDMDMADDMADGQICGGIQGIPCEQGWFCEFEAGNCQGADLQGVCVEAGEICTEQYEPVCGCDGKTYGNDCQRRAAMVQKDYDGECKEAA